MYEFKPNLLTNIFSMKIKSIFSLALATCMLAACSDHEKEYEDP